MEITLTQVAGTLLVLIGTYSVHRVRLGHKLHADKLAHFVVLDGEVTRFRKGTSLERNPDLDDSAYQEPMIEYVANGIRYVIPGHSATRIGTMIKVAYNPALPSDAIQVERVDKYAMVTSVAVLAAGVVLLALSGLFDISLLN